MITLDAETYYDKDYTLSKLTTAEYVLSPLFEIIGVSVKVDDAPTQWFSGDLPSTIEWLKQFDWDNHTFVAQNAMFDGSILEWVCGIKPRDYFCTMMGSRPWVVPFTGKSNLKVIAPYLGVGQKGTEVMRAITKRRADFSPSQLHSYGQYCVNDTELAYGVAKKLMPKFPQDELELIDLTIKKFTRPKLLLDREVLAARLDKIETVKAKALLAVGLADNKLLMSNTQLARELVKRGVAPPMKPSPTNPARMAYAFAKTDTEFLALRNHPKVGHLVKARLLFKSTMEQSRLERFIAVADAHDNKLAVPLLYAGAHTLRFSGLDKLNLQNLTRGSALRQAIRAPAGYKIVAADLSQIEARIVACLAGQKDLIQAFANGDDVYSLFATRLYGRKITEETDPDERFVGKTAILSLGYQAGAERFHDAMATTKVPMSLIEATNVVRTYRNTYFRIVDLWQRMQHVVASMERGQSVRIGPPDSTWPCCKTEGESVVLPNGMQIFYPGLLQGREGFEYGQLRTRAKLYGGKLTENIVQALARIVMTNAELRLARKGLKAVMSVHDELIFVVPEQHAEKVMLAIEKAMTAPVPWLPELPVACKVKFGNTYAECK